MKHFWTVNAMYDTVQSTLQIPYSRHQYATNGELTDYVHKLWIKKKLVKPLGYFVKGIYFVISALLLYQRKVYHTYYIMVLPTM